MNIFFLQILEEPEDGTIDIVEFLAMEDSENLFEEQRHFSKFSFIGESLTQQLMAASPPPPEGQ